MKKSNAVFVEFTLIFAISFSLLSCDSGSPSEPGNLSPYEIQGTIVDNDGNLLSDVNLYLIFNLTDADKAGRLNSLNNDSISYLHQNFPNPFTAGTNISLNISARALVKLFITHFNSGDTLYTIINSTLEEGFYALFLDENFVNDLYRCKLWVKVSEDTVYQDQIMMLKNNDIPDSLVTEVNPNYEIFNSSFVINYASVPFGAKVQVTESSPNVLTAKIISRELTFVLAKAGYKNLIETHPINSAASTKIIFRMERE